MNIAEWSSRLACLFDLQEVGGSNPPSATNFKQYGRVRRKTKSINQIRAQANNLYRETLARTYAGQYAFRLDPNTRLNRIREVEERYINNINRTNNAGNYQGVARRVYMGLANG